MINNAGGILVIVNIASTAGFVKVMLVDGDEDDDDDDDDDDDVGDDHDVAHFSFRSVN